MLKIRRSPDRLIFNIGIHILVIRHPYIETVPCADLHFLWLIKTYTVQVDKIIGKQRPTDLPQFYCCWCPFNAMSGYRFNVINTEYSGFSTRSVDKNLQFCIQWVLSNKVHFSVEAFSIETQSSRLKLTRTCFMWYFAIISESINNFNIQFIVFWKQLAIFFWRSDTWRLMLNLAPDVCFPVT